MFEFLKNLFGVKPKHNQINVIRPYKWEGIWVFDDPALGLDKEALVAGMPEIIEHVTDRLCIPNPQNGFVCIFSKDEFPDAKLRLDWVREEGGGNVYRLPQADLEGWLCPALFKYFDKAPAHIYVDVKAAGAG